jgi:hypothetical protein
VHSLVCAAWRGVRACLRIVRGVGGRGQRQWQGEQTEDGERVAAEGGFRRIEARAGTCSRVETMKEQRLSNIALLFAALPAHTVDAFLPSSVEGQG